MCAWSRCAGGDAAAEEVAHVGHVRTDARHSARRRGRIGDRLARGPRRLVSPAVQEAQGASPQASQLAWTRRPEADRHQYAPYSCRI